MILSGARVVLLERTLELGWVRVDGQLITEVGAGTPPEATQVDLGGSWLVPGYVDMHVHGGFGASFQSSSVEDVSDVVAFHRGQGTTTMLASLVTRPIDELVDSVAGLRELVANGLIAGIHLEGPFLNPARGGAHDPTYLRSPGSDDMARLLNAGAEAVSMVTLAPELDNGLDAVRQVVDAGSVAAIGHTNASYAVTREAIEAGARVATHLFNAMPPIHHREPGPVVALLEDDRVIVEVIQDGVHLHDSVLRGVFRATPPGRVCLVSDAIAASGLGDGSYELGDRGVIVQDGVARLVEGGSLAGSTLTMAQAVRNTVAAGVDVHDAVIAATATPAQTLGIDAGIIDRGRPADLLVLTPDLEVTAVMRDGAWDAKPDT